MAKKSLEQIHIQQLLLTVKPRQVYSYNETGDLYQIDTLSHPTGEHEEWIVNYHRLSRHYTPISKSKVTFWRFLSEFEGELLRPQGYAASSFI